MWTGSGAIMASLLHHLDYVPYALAIDLSEKAASLAKRTFIENNVKCDIINTSMFDSLNLYGKIDLLIWNPPYVPTSPEEYASAQANRNIDASYAGGIKGNEFTDKFLELVPQLMAPGGVVYMLVIGENEMDFGDRAELVLKRKVPGELEFVYKFRYWY